MPRDPFGRSRGLIPGARSLLLLGGVLAVCGAGVLRAAEVGSAAAAPATIELRKSFRFMRRPGRQGERSEGRSSTPLGSAPRVDAPLPQPPPRLQPEAIAAALGEELQATGTLHLPGIDGGGIVLHGAATPVLATTTGRLLIIDRDRTIAPETVEQISRRWPGYSVIQPLAGATLRDLLDSILDAAGYDTVLRASPLTFGQGVTIRYTPDFFVLRSDRDLLMGESRALSVVDPAAALPAELRELAAEYQVRITELAPDGAPLGIRRAPWRDPSGRVTTMGGARSSQIVAEIAGALGCSVQRRVALPSLPGEPDVDADLLVSLGGNSFLVFERAEPASRAGRLVQQGEAVTLAGPADLTDVIGSLLERLALPSIGPAVEFFREPPPGSTQRFVITVPGWLTRAGGRRLLITGAAVPLLVRLYLTREGVDIFEYRSDGR